MDLKESSIVPVLAVDDLDRAVGFYRDRLGLEVRRLHDDPGTALVETGRSGRLLLYTSSYRRGETTAASFLVDDVETTVSELRGRGVAFEDYDLPGLKTVGGIASMGDLRSAWFKDSEGNTIAISNELPEVARKAA
jgi:catechol 2,3-dioxygenase-like lactoylglutathione lyase family enzyme